MALSKDELKELLNEIVSRNLEKTVQTTVEAKLTPHSVGPQVATYIKESLSSWKAWLISLATLVTITITGYGYHSYSELLADVKKQLGEAHQLQAEAKKKKEEIEKLQQEVQGQVEQSRENTQTLIESTQKNNQNVLESQGKMSDLQAQLNDLVTNRLGEIGQTTLDIQRERYEINRQRLEMERKSLELDGKIADIRQKSGQVDVKFSEINTKSGEIDSKHSEIRKKYDELIDADEGLKSLRAINDRLVRVALAQTVVLRAHQKTKPIRLPDVSTGDSSKYYEVVFIVEDVKKRAELHFEIKKPDGTVVKDLEMIRQQPKRDPDGTKIQKFPLYGTPYLVEVEQYFHSLLASDFIVLKIRPNEELFHD